MFSFGVNCSSLYQAGVLTPIFRSPPWQIALHAEVQIVRFDYSWRSRIIQKQVVSQKAKSTAPPLSLSILSPFPMHQLCIKSWSRNEVVKSFETPSFFCTIPPRNGRGQTRSLSQAASCASAFRRRRRAGGRRRSSRR